MILIVEGSNRAGTTTLISHLVEHMKEHNIPVMSYRKRYAIDDEVDDETTFDSVMKATNQRMLAEVNLLTCIDENFPEPIYIFDRFYLSELIYGRYYRGYNNLEMLQIERILRDAGAKLLFVTSKYEHIKPLLPLFISDDRSKFIDIQSDFAKEFRFVTLDKTSIEFDPEKLEEITEHILEFLEV